MKKVVSQLKRTLSTVLAMMMVVTAIPQMAMPVFADDMIVDEVVYAEAAAEEVAVEAEDAIVENSVSPNWVEPLGEKASNNISGGYDVQRYQFLTVSKNGVVKVKKNLTTDAPSVRVEGTLTNKNLQFSIVESNTDGLVINKKSGKLTLKKGTVVSTNAIEATIKVEDLGTGAATTIYAPEFTEKEIKIGGIALVNETEDGKLEVVDGELEVDYGAPYLAAIFKDGVKVEAGKKYEYSDLVDYDCAFKLATSNKKIASVSNYARNTFGIWANKPGKAKIKIAASGMKAQTLNVKVVYKKLSVSDNIVITAWDDNDGAISKTVSKNTVASISVNNNPAYHEIVGMKIVHADGTEETSWGEYGIKRSVKGAKAAKYNKYNTNYYYKTKTDKNGMVTAKDITFAYKVGKDKYSVKLTNNYKVKKFSAITVDKAKDNKIYADGAVSENQVLKLKATGDAVSANNIRLIPDETKYNEKNHKGYDALMAYDSATISANQITFLKDAGLVAGTYKMMITGEDAEGNEYAYAPITIKVQKAKLQKASLVIKNSKVTVSTNDISGNELQMAAKGKNDAKAEIIKMGTLSAKKGNTVNDFSENFKVVKVGDELKVVLTKRGAANYDKIKADKKEQVGYIVYQATTYVKKDGTQAGKKTYTKKIVVTLK